MEGREEGEGMTDDVLMTDEGVDRRVRIVTRWLENVSKAVERKFDFLSNIESFYSMADNLRGIDYSKDRVKTSPTPDAIPNAIIEAEEMGDVFCELYESVSGRVMQAELALLKMEDQREASALSLYYLAFDSHGKRKYDTWEKVGKRMGYSYDGMMKLRRRALLHAYDVMPHIERDPQYAAL